MQGTPSGEAFIQMDSEKSAESSAVTKNKKLMFVGGVGRYVEVIQCSGDEMALVLQQGLPAAVLAPLSSLPQSAASVHAAPAGVLPTGFWSLPPPTASANDLSLLLQRNAIPLPSVPGISLIFCLYCIYYFIIRVGLVGWLNGRTSVSDRRTFTGLHQQGQLSLSSSRGR